MDQHMTRPLATAIICNHLRNRGFDTAQVSDGSVHVALANRGISCLEVWQALDFVVDYEQLAPAVGGAVRIDLNHTDRMSLSSPFAYSFVSFFGIESLS